jgi:hypothetical protein
MHRTGLLGPRENDVFSNERGRPELKTSDKPFNGIGKDREKVEFDEGTRPPSAIDLGHEMMCECSERKASSLQRETERGESNNATHEKRSSGQE